MEFLWPNLGASSGIGGILCSGIGRILFLGTLGQSQGQVFFFFFFFWSFYPTEGMTIPSSWLINGEAEALESTD